MAVLADRGSGRNFYGRLASRAKAQAYDAAAGRRLRELAAELVTLNS